MDEKEIKNNILVIPKTAIQKIIESESLITIIFKNKEEKEKWIKRR